MPYFAYDSCMHIHIHTHTNTTLIKGSLEVKLPTMWRDEKQRGKSQREERSRREKETEAEERRYSCAKCYVQIHLVFF